MRYRFCLTDHLGHIRGACDRDCGSDAEAIAQVRHIQRRGFDVEVWRGDVLVATVREPMPA